MFSLFFHKTVDMIFHMLSLPSFKKQWIWFSLYCHCCLTKQWMWFFTFCLWSHSQSSECSFPCAATNYLVSSGCISRNASTAVLLSSECRFLHVVTVLFQKSVDGFSCVVTAHSISSGWISICCQCCYHYVSLYVVTNQWIWFSTYLDWSLSKSCGFNLSCLVTA